MRLCLEHLGQQLQAGVREVVREVPQVQASGGAPKGPHRPTEGILHDLPDHPDLLRARRPTPPAQGQQARDHQAVGRRLLGLIRAHARPDSPQELGVNRALHGHREQLRCRVPGAGRVVRSPAPRPLRQDTNAGN
jgi:hypothetical protein